MLLKWKADYKDQLLASLTAEIPFQSWIELILLFRAKSLKRQSMKWYDANYF